MTPRLMDYDMILIVPYAALLISLAPRLNQRALEKGLPWIFVAVLGVGIACNILHLKHWHRTHVAMFLFCSLTLMTGARLAAVRLGRISKSVRRLSDRDAREDERARGKRNEEGMLPDGGKGGALPFGEAVRTLFNQAIRWRTKDRRAGI
jgi:hypothetical protein